MSATKALRTFLLAATALSGLAACADASGIGDATLKQLSNGITADSVYRVVGTGPLQPLTSADSVQVDRGFRRSRYFLNGESYDVIWYREQPAPIDSIINTSEVAPILLRNDSVQGWGWKHFDKAAAEIGLPNPKTPMQN